MNKSIGMGCVKKVKKLNCEKGIVKKRKRKDKRIKIKGKKK